MAKYYFLAASLPALQLTAKPEIAFTEFVDLASVNLSSHDYAKIQTMRRFYDIQNIRALWKNEELDPRGILNSVELEDAVLSRVGIPVYVADFLDRFDSKEEQLRNFPALISAYFRNEKRVADGFLKDYLSFEHDWRLIFAAFRAKKLGRNLENELQFEDPYDPIVAQILSQKDSSSFMPPIGYEELLPMFNALGDEPLELHKALCIYRFQKISEKTGVDLFSTDAILAYAAQLIIVEKWHELDHVKGMENIHKAIDRKVSL